MTLSSGVTVDTTDPVTITVPPESYIWFPNGTVIELARFGTGAVTVAGGSGVTMFGTGTHISARFATAKLHKVSTDSWLLSGSLSA